jgi:glycosyltransferase involved in cell wall biosynthesis
MIDRDHDLVQKTHSEAVAQFRRQGNRGGSSPASAGALLGDDMISFIIPAYNEEQLLGRTLTVLTAAARALRQPFEVVVVDDASTDRTAAIAREHSARVVAVEYRQIAATRNAGAKVANGEMFVFIDADTVVTNSAIAAAVGAIRRGAVGGGCAFHFDGRLPLYGRIMAAMAGPLYRALGLASGCFLFCTREAFRAAGGFDDGLFGAEEAALSRALRRQGRFVILRESVTTSGRKLRAHSAREVLGLLVRLALAGPKSVRRREGLELWYGERRPDPQSP